MRFYNKELFTNLLIILIGLVFALLPPIIIKDISIPISVISISIGCSLIATGISVLLSFIYRERKSQFSQYLSDIGLSDILIDKELYDHMVKAVSNAKESIYYAQVGAPLLLNQNKELFREKAQSGVKIKILINPQLFAVQNQAPTYTSHDNQATREAMYIAMEAGIEIRETDYPLTRVLIVDDVAIQINTRLSNHPLTSFVYKKTNQKFHSISISLAILSLFGIEAVIKALLKNKQH